MHNLNKRFLCMLMALVMIVSMLPATVFATGETAVLEGWNVTLGDDIGVKFTLDSADYTVSATVNGNAVTPVISENVVTVNVAAAQMNDTIGLTVQSGEETVHTGEYSVRSYADTILAGDYDAEVKDMVLAMLHYGAAAQTYFGYNAGNLANADVDSYENAAIPETVEDAAYATGTVDGVAYYGASLLFLNKTTVRFYFDVTGEIGDYTFKVGETTYTPAKKDDKYYVDVAGINPQDLEDMIVLTVSDGTDSIEVGYSPLNYIVRMNTKGSDALKGALVGLYNYHLEALAYTNYLETVFHTTFTAGSYAMNANAVYASVGDNAAPVERYKATAEQNVQLLRNGETVNVSSVGNIYIEKNESNCFIKVNSDAIGEYAPVQVNDVLILSGDFVGETSGSILRVATAYVYIEQAYVEGTNGTAVISDTMPILPSTVEATINNGSCAMNANAVYASAAANDAPVAAYTATAEDNLVLIRNGETLNVGIVGRVSIEKRENDYLLKVNSDCIGEYAPLQADDLLIFQGDFYYAAQKVTLSIPATYVYVNQAYVEGTNGTAVISDTMPILPSTVEATINNGSCAMNANAVYASAAANDAPVAAYTATAEDNLVLIRNGETLNVGIVGRVSIEKRENDYLLKVNSDCIGEYAPLQADDLLIFQGDFYYAAQKVTLSIPATYVYVTQAYVEGTNGTAVITDTMPTLPSTVDCTITAGNFAMNANAVYGNAAANDAPVAAYSVTTADNIKLIRDGVTTSIGVAGRVAIEKRESDYLLKVNSDCLGEYAPLVNGDILVLEGEFYNASSKVTLNVAAAYIYVYRQYVDGTNGEVVISAQMPVIAETGVFASGAMNANAIYTSAAANDAPVAAYYAMTTDSIKLIRNGETVDVGIIGYSTIEKRASDYLISVNSGSLGEYAPLQAGDILIIDGDFYNKTENAVLRVTTNYVFIYKAYDSSNGETVISATAPAIYESTVPAGTAMNANNIYATATNDAPQTTYQSLKASNIKLIRDGVTVDVAVERGVAIEKTASNNFLKPTSAAIGDYAPLQAGDVLIFEGDFYNKANNAILRLPATYVFIYKEVDSSNGEVVITSTAPSIVECGALSGTQMNANVVYTNAANEVPNGNYRQLVAEDYQLIRDGVTYNIGTLRTKYFIQKNDSWMYLNINSDAIGSYAPLQAGDVLVVKGQFYDKENNVILRMEDTYVFVYKAYDSSNGEVVISSAAPSIYESTVPAGTAMNANNIYATATNDAPQTTYQSLKASNIKLIRDGETIDVAVERGVAIEKTDTYNFLKPTSAAIGDYAPLQAGDVLIFEGDFYNKANNAILRLPATYVFVYKAVDSSNGEVVITSTAPSIVECGALSGTQMNANVVYTTATNDAPTGNYRLLAAEDYQLIRGGETYNIGTLRTKPVIEKTDSWIYLKINSDAIGSYAPLQAGDVLVVKGQFYNKESNAILRVEDTYVYVETAYVTGTNGTVSITATMPDLTVPPIEVGSFTAGSGWSESGIYMTAAENDASSAGEDMVVFQATSEDNIKLVRDGVTTSVAIVDGGAICKVDDTTYFLYTNSDVFSSGLPLENQDYLIIEGEFFDANMTEETISVTKTYIYNNNGTMVFSTTEPTIGEEVTVDVSITATNDTAMNANAIYAPVLSNLSEVPVQAYYATSADNVKLIRDGETISIGLVGKSTVEVCADKVLIGTNAASLGEYAPLQGGDVLVIEGAFKKDTTTINIATVYCFVYKPYDSSNGSIHISAALPTVYESGVLSGSSANANNIYTTGTNNAPTTTYQALKSSNIKLVRDGVTMDVAVERGLAIEKTSSYNFLKCNADILGEYAPFESGDLLIFEGDFYNRSQHIIYRMPATYVYKYGTGSEVIIGSSAPTVYESGELSGSVINANVVYASATNDAPTGNYRLMDAENYQLIRDGVSYSVGTILQDVVTKYNTDGGIYLQIGSGYIGNYAPLIAGDMLVVKGDFYDKASNSILRIPETYVTVVTGWTSDDGNGRVVIRTEDPLTVDVGQLSYKEYADGTAWHGNGIHFMVEKSNPATANTDWSVEYKPSDAECIKLIRDGVTYNVGNTNAGTLIKIDETDYYLKLDENGYTIGGTDAGYMPLVDGDILVIEGQFNGTAKALGYNLVVDRTYIAFYAPSGATAAKGGNVVFSYALNPTAVSLANGSSTTLSASGATSWSSSDESKATVNNGVVTAKVGRGTVIITAETASGPVYWEISLYDSTSYGDVRLPSGKKDMNLSVWAGSYHLFTDEHLQRLQAAGVTTIIGLIRSSDAEMVQILDRLNEYGMNALIDIRSRDSEGNITAPWDGATVPSYWNHAAVAGALVMDEPCATEFDTIASLKTKFETLMPGKIFYVNLYPYDAGGERLYGSSWYEYIKDYKDDYVDKFVSKVSPDYVAWDSYPLFTDNTIRPNYFLNFEIATDSGLPAWYTMLSAGHSTSTDRYVTPNEAQLRWQMNLAMTYGIQDLSHYVYATHGSIYNYDCMYDIANGTFNETLYAAVTAAGQQVKAWEDIFTSYTWQGVAKVDVGSSNEMMNKLSNTLTLGDTYGLTAVSSDQDMLVGIYELDGAHAYMITNAGSITGSTENGNGAKPYTMTADEDVVLTLSSGSYKCAAVISQGVITYVPVENNTVTIDVDAYEGVFVIPVAN